MKRKAAFLDEPSPNAEWPSFEYASSTSTASPESVKAFADHNQTHAHWNVGRVPYLNSRTRKRYRDQRPDEQSVHQNTLAKLYNAQRQMQVETQNLDWQMSSPAVSPLTQWPPNNLSNRPTPMWQADSGSLGQPEKNQRSLDSFFGGSRRHDHERKTAPGFFAFSGSQTTVPALLMCEDCNTVLQPINGNASLADVDAMSMDIDFQDNEWSCASCSRRVCDTCAVRGDHRICLECAVPGGG